MDVPCRVGDQVREGLASQHHAHRLVVPEGFGPQAHQTQGETKQQPKQEQQPVALTRKCLRFVGVGHIRDHRENIAQEWEIVDLWRRATGSIRTPGYRKG